MSDLVFRISVVLAISTGSAGFVLAVLASKMFQGAPFGRALGILVPFMAAFTLYHALLLVGQGLTLLALSIESLAFVLIVVFVGSMVRLHYKSLRRPQPEVSAE